MTTLTISANSVLTDDRCNFAYYCGKVLDRRAVRTMAGRIAGTAFHAGVAVFMRGGSIANQDAAIDAVFAADPTPLDDYRQASFVRDALAQWRVERGVLFDGWRIEEVEAHGEVELGTIYWGVVPARSDFAPNRLFVKRPVGEPEREVRVMYEFRRDLVAVSPEGQRFVWDWKTASRNEEAELQASRNSGALMGYCVTYTIQTGLPVHGAYLGRVIMRKPSRTGVAYEFPNDPPIYFPQDRLDQWRRQTLVKARRILERDPQNLDDWPLASHVNGACRGVWGTCDYLGVCQLPLADRALKLSTDEFQSASEAKRKDQQRDRASATNGAEGEP